MTVELILASASPSRQSLMRNAGLVFSIVPASIDERAIEAKLLAAAATPADVVLELAIAKAAAISAAKPGALVLGCDQTMALGATIYHKPKTVSEAHGHLASLSGKTHRLISAAALVQDGVTLWSTAATADLTVRVLSEAFIARHLQRVGEVVLTSVGAYQLEGEGIQLFSAIEGDYFTILGLPLLPLLTKLRALGMIDA